MGLLVEWTKVSIPKLFFHAFRGGDLAGPVGPRKPQENEAELLVKRVCESLDGTLGEGREGGREGGSIAWGWW